MADFQKRLAEFRTRFMEQGLDASIVVGWDNLYYLTGMSSYQSTVGSVNLMPIVVTPDDVEAIVTNGFAKSCAEDYPYIHTIHAFSEDMLIAPRVPRDELLRKSVPRRARRVGLDMRFCSLPNFQDIQAHLEGVVLVDTTPMLFAQRMVKDPEELSAIREAARITDEIYETMVRGGIRVEDTERRIASKITVLAAERGCGLPFVQVFAGSRAYYQNVTPSGRPLRKGEVVLLDFGVTVRGYNTDITRAATFGRASPEQRDVCAKVKEILQTTIGDIRPGITARDIDRRALRAFREAGVGEHYVHRTGHGLGIARGAEPPDLAETVETEIKANMVLAIEQGIYMPHLGIRLEDNLIVTEQGTENLTRCSLDIAEMA